MRWQPDNDPTVELRDDEALRSAVEARGDERLLTRVSAESATFAGTLRDLAERRVGTSLLLRGDHAVQGTLVTVAVDHVVLVTRADQLTYVRTSAIVSARTDPGVRVPIAQGHRPPGDDLALLERLGRWEADRPIVAILVDGRTEPLRGRLIAVGEDVVSLDVADDRHPSYLPDLAIRAVMMDRR